MVSMDSCHSTMMAEKADFFVPSTREHYDDYSTRHSSQYLESMKPQIHAAFPSAISIRNSPRGFLEYSNSSIATSSS